MLRYSFGLQKEADTIEKAITEVLQAGYRTADIYTDGMIKLGTKEMGTEIAKRI